MKKFLLPLAVASLMIIPLQGALALPADFSLNPFTGFKNCKCKEQIDKCNACTGAAAPVCPICTKAFPKKEPCNTCEQMQMQVYEVIEVPACPCGRNYN